MLTDDHVHTLNEVWNLYEPVTAYEMPLPASPPPEVEVEVEVEVEQPEGACECDNCIRRYGLNCSRFLNARTIDEHRQQWSNAKQDFDEAELLLDNTQILEHQHRGQWVNAKQKFEKLDEERAQRQRAAQEPVSVTMQPLRPEATSECGGKCDGDRCFYECGEACGASEPYNEVIDLTCEEQGCDYGCECNYTQQQQPKPYSCDYGCTYSCGAKEGEDCKDELPHMVECVAHNAIESDEDYSDMPPLIPLASYVRSKGWHNPEEDTEDEGETEIVDAPPTKSPKAKPLFPYNHPKWPSPRAKVLVQWMLANGITSKRSMSSVLEKEVKTLTHDNCMSFLAARYGLTGEQLLESNIRQLHNPSGNNTCYCAFCKKESISSSW